MPFLTLLQLQRTRAGLTLQEIAAKLGLKSHSYVADIFSGKKQLPLEAVDQWADVLKFEKEDLLDLYQAAINDLAPPWFRDLVKRTDQHISDLETKIKTFEAHIIQEALSKSNTENQRR